MNLEQIKQYLDSQDIAPRYYNCDFLNHPAITARKEEIWNFLKDPKGNVLMSGSCGTGKTLVSVCIMAYYSQQHGPKARFFNAESLYNTWLQESKFGDSSTFCSKLSNVPLLVLDDLGQGEISDSFKRWLYNLINKRWEHERATVMTTNLNGKKFSEIFGDALLSRAMDGKIWKFDGPDNRIARQ